MDLKNSISNSLVNKTPLLIPAFSFNTPPWDHFLTHLFSTKQEKVLSTINLIVPSLEEFPHPYRDVVVLNDLYSFLMGSSNINIQSNIYLSPSVKEADDYEHTKLIWQCVGSLKITFKENFKIIVSKHSDLIVIPKGIEYSIEPIDASATVTFRYK